MELDPARLVGPRSRGGFRAAGDRRPRTGGCRRGRSCPADREVLVEAGGFVRSAEELASVVVAESARPAGAPLGRRARRGRAGGARGLRDARRAGPARAVSCGDALGEQAAGRQRHRRRPRDREEARALEPRLFAAERPDDGHARLRRDVLREIQRALEAHGSRDPLGRSPDGSCARAPRSGCRPAGRAGDARPDALRLSALRLHAEPDHALRADLLDRYPRRRRDRGRREHRPAPADAGRAGTVARRRSPSKPPTRSATRRCSRPSPSSRPSCPWASSEG